MNTAKPVHMSQVFGRHTKLADRYGNCSCTCHVLGGEHATPCCGPGSPNYKPGATQFDPSVEETIVPTDEGHPKVYRTSTGRFSSSSR